MTHSVHTPRSSDLHVPTLIGELGLATRSMWWKRSGRPRSPIRKYRLARTLVSAPIRLTLRSRGRPVRSAPAASIAEPADSPPENRYAAIIQFHTGFLRDRKSAV